MQRQETEAAVFIAVTDGQRALTVRETSKPSPHWVKFPTGGVENDETPKATMLRELEEETGIEAGDVIDIRIVSRRPSPSRRRPHIQYFGIVHVSPAVLDRYKDVVVRAVRVGIAEEERFEVVTRRNQDLRTMPDWHPSQREFLETYLEAVAA